MSIACPKSAISMKEDIEGFLYPQINNEKCVKCYKCLKICPLKRDWIIGESPNMFKHNE